MKIIDSNLKFTQPLIKRRKTTEIILHCCASKNDCTVETIHNMHIKERGWKGIAYNFLIRFNGDIYKGRGEEYEGGHTINHNSNSIGIVTTGGLDSNGKAKDTRTKEQKESLYELVDYLLKKYNLRITDVHCHNEYANKQCPCYSITQFRDEYLKWKEKKYSEYLKEKNKICNVANWF